MSVTQTRPVSRDAVESVYLDLADEIGATARRFAAQYNQEAEECEADARLFFLQAYHSYDPAKGKLAPRVATIVWMRLLDKLRLKASRYELRLQGRMAVRARMSDKEFHRAVARDTGGDVMEGTSQRRRQELLAVPAGPAPRPFELHERTPDLSENADLLDWVTDLSEDAETVVRLVLDGAAELGAALADSAHPSEPGTVRTGIRRVLRAAGWAPKRISDAFREIGDAL